MDEVSKRTSMRRARQTSKLLCAVDCVAIHGGRGKCAVNTVNSSAMEEFANSSNTEEKNSSRMGNSIAGAPYTTVEHVMRSPFLLSFSPQQQPLDAQSLFTSLTPGGSAGHMGYTCSAVLRSFSNALENRKSAVPCMVWLDSASITLSTMRA